MRTVERMVRLVERMVRGGEMGDRMDGDFWFVLLIVLLWLSRVFGLLEGLEPGGWGGEADGHRDVNS